MIFIGILIVITILIVSFYSSVFWTTHIDMVKGATRIHGYGNIYKFIEQFNKYNWDNESWNGYSLWDRNNNCEIHADIIKFNDIGMIMRTPWDYFLMNRFIRKYFKENIKINYKW